MLVTKLCYRCPLEEKKKHFLVKPYGKEKSDMEKRHTLQEVHD